MASSKYDLSCYPRFVNYIFNPVDSEGSYYAGDLKLLIAAEPHFRIVTYGAREARLFPYLQTFFSEGSNPTVSHLESLIENPSDKFHLAHRDNFDRVPFYWKVLQRLHKQGIVHCALENNSLRFSPDRELQSGENYNKTYIYKENFELITKGKAMGGVGGAGNNMVGWSWK